MMSWLDFKLAMRMLARYPGLTAVGGVAIAVAVAICAAFFEFTHDLADPTLPLDEGDRVVGIRNWDQTTNAPEARSLRDFVTWRDELRSVDDLGAYATIERNLITDDGGGEPVKVAEISASAFRVARVPPLLGRPLVEADEQGSAAAVAVIGYGVWQARFGSDPQIVGRTVQLGRDPHTVVGVMPEGFTFPVSHSLWVPLRINVSDIAHLDGPSIRTFGRLAPGVSLESTQAELASIGARAAADFPETHGRLRPQVLPYTDSFLDEELTLIQRIYIFQSFLVMILIVCCANVATLMFARTATRQSEIVVRSALGASRARIVMQLFAEALVLASVAAIVGMVAADAALAWMTDLFWSAQGANARPFWWDEGLAPATVLYALALTILGGVVAGVLPALKGTGRRTQMGLQEMAGRGSSLQLGGVWTVIIVTQVALSVAFLPMALSEGWDALGAEAGSSAIRAQDFLSARLELDAPPLEAAASDADPVAPNTRFNATYQELARRLVTEPDVTSIAFGNRLPGMDHPRRRIEVDEALLSSVSGANQVRTASIDLGFFDALNAPVLAGRTFHSGDLASDARVVMVNQSFAQQLLGGRNPIGRRVRYVDAAGTEGTTSTGAEGTTSVGAEGTTSIGAEGTTSKGAEGTTLVVPKDPEPWLEIVGMVPDLGMNVLNASEAAGLYEPMALGHTASVRVAVRVASDPEAFAPRLRDIASAVDPTMRLYELRRLDTVARTDQVGYRVVGAVLALIASIALLLSAAGIYSLMSLTVSQRTREIGIRAALGAHPARIAATIFSRALAQVCFGALAGIAILFAAGAEEASNITLLGAVAVLMMLVGVAACGVPAMRALRIQPTEALKDAG